MGETMDPARIARIKRRAQRLAELLRTSTTVDDEAVNMIEFLARDVLLGPGLSGPERLVELAQDLLAKYAQCDDLPDHTTTRWLAATASSDMLKLAADAPEFNTSLDVLYAALTCLVGVVKTMGKGVVEDLRAADRGALSMRFRMNAKSGFPFALRVEKHAAHVAVVGDALASLLRGHTTRPATAETTPAAATSGAAELPR